MQSFEPKSFNIPNANNRYVLDTINHHVNTIKQTILQLKDNESNQNFSESSNQHSVVALSNKSKFDMCSVQKRKLPKVNERELQSPKQRIDRSVNQSYVHTEPRKKFQERLCINNYSGITKESSKRTLNQNQYIKELNKIDSATLDALRHFIISNETNNQLHEKTKRRLARIIQREHRLFMIASDEYLQIQKSDLENQRSVESQNLDFILSKLNNADYYNINLKLKNQNNNKEKIKWKEMNMIETQRHEKVQRLFNRIDKKQ